MRAVDPTISIGAHGNSTTWFNTVIANASSSIDWLDVHDYPTYNWTSGYDVFRLNNKTLTTDLNKALSSIAAASPADQARLKVGITETNTIDWATNGWPNVNDLGHALVAFDMIGQQLSKPQLEFTQLWNTRWIHNVAFSPGTGTNPVLNPSFENDLANWNVSGSAAITTTSVYSGSKALQGNSGAFVTQNITLGAGLSRTLSAYARTTNTSAWTGIGVHFLNSSGNKITSVSSTITGTSYGKYTVPFTTPAGTTKIQVWFYVGSGVTSYLDQVSISDRVVPEVYDAFAPDNSFLPAGRAVALWGQFLRDDLVQSSRSASVIAYASRSNTDQTMTVWLLNKQTASVDVNLTLNNYTPAASASAWRFAGNGPSDFQPTYTALPAVTVPGSTMPIALPQTSITVLVFSPATTPGFIQRITAAADSYVVQGSASTNFGTESKLKVKHTSYSPQHRRALAKFDLRTLAGNATQVQLILKLEGVGGESVTNRPIEIRKVIDDSWTESGVTWNNQPALNSVLTSFTVTAADVGREIAIDVTSYINQERGGDGFASFAIVQPNGGNALVRFHSRESTQGPLLEAR